MEGTAHRGDDQYISLYSNLISPYFTLVDFQDTTRSRPGSTSVRGLHKELAIDSSDLSQALERAGRCNSKHQGAIPRPYPQLHTFQFLQIVEHDQCVLIEVKHTVAGSSHMPMQGHKGPKMSGQPSVLCHCVTESMGGGRDATRNILSRWSRIVGCKCLIC